MVRRKRGVAIIMLKYAVIGLGASVQQAALGAEMLIPPKLEIKVIKGAVDSDEGPQSLGTQLPAGGRDPLTPPILLQPDLVASASQTAGDYISGGQEIKNADTPAEPQAVMREIKSVTRLSSSKQRRRKPKMASVPIGSQAVAQETKESGSSAAAQENEESDTLDKPLAGTQEIKETAVLAKPGEQKRGLKVASAGIRGYGMAPIRWGASISESVAFKRSSHTSHYLAGSSLAPVNTQTGDVVNMQTAEIHGATYIMQPYIAKIDGNIGVNSSKNTTTTKDLIDNNIVSTNGSSRDNKLFGNGSLSLFSQSRFPFTMALGNDNDRSKSLLDTQNSARKYLTFGQSFSPLNSASFYHAGYTQNTLTTTSDLSTLGVGTNPNGTVVHSYWDGSYSTITSEHRINASTRYNEKYTSLLPNTVASRTDDFSVRDTYLPANSLLTLQTFANINSFADLTGNRTKYLLGNTNGTWQPEDEDMPLFVDGNVHLFRQSRLAVNQLVADTLQSLGGTIGATYNFSKNLDARVDGSVGSSVENGARSLTTTEQGRVNYRSNATKLWKNSLYSWNAHGGAINNTLAGTTSSPSPLIMGPGVFGGVGHGLSIPTPVNMFDRKWEISSAINQSLSASYNRTNGQSITIGNSGSVMLNPVYFFRSTEWQGGQGKTDGIATSAIFTVTDSRTIAKIPTHSRYYNLQLREGNKSYYSRYGVDFEASLEAAQGSAGTDITGKGIATYKKSRLFSVRGLAYTGKLEVVGKSSNFKNVLPYSNVNNNNAKNPRFPWSLDQYLTYRIGQNEAALRAYIRDELGVKDASLWLLFRAYRTIGN